jgi:hypothetical protein
MNTGIWTGFDQRRAGNATGAPEAEESLPKRPFLAQMFNRIAVTMSFLSKPAVHTG